MDFPKHTREPASYPDVSLSMKMYAQRKAGRRQRARLRLPSVPFPWSLAAHHQSLAFRARLCLAKTEAPEEEAAREPFKIPQRRRRQRHRFKSEFTSFESLSRLFQQITL